MEPIGPEVRKELGRFGGAEGMSDLVAAWPAAVGETVAANAWPARLARDGRKNGNASSTTSAFELQQRAAAIAAPRRAGLGKAVALRAGATSGARSGGPRDAAEASSGAYGRAGARRPRPGGADRLRRTPQIGRKSCANEPRSGR